MQFDTVPADRPASLPANLAPHRQHFDLMIPVPPSTPRKIQPVIILFNGIGAAVGLPVLDCIRTTRPTAQFKGVADPEERRKLLDGLYAVDATHTTGKRVLCSTISSVPA